MRITLVIASLSGGGAERVASSVANYWAGKGWEISLLTMCGGTRADCFELSSQVKRLDLGVSPRPSSFPDQKSLLPLLEQLAGGSQAERGAFMGDLNLILALREAISRSEPDVVISFIDLTNIRVMLATHGLGLPVIVSEQCDPHHTYLAEGWQALRRRSYPRARRLVVLTEEAAQYFSGWMEGRVRVIPNSIPDEARPAVKERRMQRTSPDKVLLAMGRLSYEKGFDLLLRAFALVAQRQPRWRLQVWGEGALRAELEQLAHALGLEGRAKFPGFTREPFEVMRRADLFVVPSRCEGFSNVLAEAMACGLAVVSFDCPSGPRHILTDGHDGLLVPPQDVAAMAARLECLMEDERERARLAQAATAVAARFGRERVMSEWEQLLSDCRGGEGCA